MADLLDFKRGQVVGARILSASVTIGTISKVMIVFEKQNKMSRQSTSLTDNRSCQRKTVKPYIELLERTVKLRH